jgi:hypothetical protein
MTTQKNKIQQVKLLPYQAKFVHDDSRYLALVAGLGSGKTKAACYKVLHLFQINKGCSAIGCEPTGPQLSIFTSEMDNTCKELGIKYTYNGGGRNSPAFYTFDLGSGQQKLWLVSAENWRRTLVGYNVSFAFIDEFDTIPNKEEALACWNALNDRCRDPKATLRQTFCTTTPEGFHAVHHLFVENATPQHKLIQVATTENIFLPPSYIQDQIKRYTPLQAKAKIYGEFVNAFSGAVYYCFDPAVNNTNKTLKDFPANAILHVGMDFNVENMSAVINVVENGKVYVIDEITAEKNTMTMIARLKRQYPNRVMYAYPDSSGKSASANASVSSITLLKDAGFQCFYKGNNPSIVKERVPSVNALFKNAADEVRCFVNLEKCKVLVKGLEQQGYKNGKPDKDSGLDHCLDALGYFLTYRYPVIGQGSLTIHR